MASGVPASDKRGSSIFVLQSHGEGGSRSRDGRRIARVAQCGGVVAALHVVLSHRRAGSGARGELATLSPSRMPAPTACRVSSLMTASS